MPRATVLVIEDDTAIRRGVVDALVSEGYATLDAGDGTAGLKLAIEGEWNLLLLDLVLPRVPTPGRRPGSGLDILRAVRDTMPTHPVIILTAMGAEEDRVRGLRLGADDYVVKPFSVTELLARVAAVLRRSPARPSDIQTIVIPGGVADLAVSEVRFAGGESATLSVRETELLRYLAAHGERVITRDEILQHVWRLDPVGVDTRTIDMHIARLRDKLRDTADAPAVLITVRGKGYRLVAGEGPR